MQAPVPSNVIGYPPGQYALPSYDPQASQMISQRTGVIMEDSMYPAVTPNTMPGHPALSFRPDMVTNSFDHQMHLPVTGAPTSTPMANTELQTTDYYWPQGFEIPGMPMPQSQQPMTNSFSQQSMSVHYPQTAPDSVSTPGDLVDRTEDSASPDSDCASSVAGSDYGSESPDHNESFSNEQNNENSMPGIEMTQNFNVQQRAPSIQIPRVYQYYPGIFEANKYQLSGLEMPSQEHRN
jgi:hypothetical protein